MSNGVQKYRATILGQSYVFISDEKEHEVLAAISMVDTTMKELVTQSSIGDISKISLLTAIKIALTHTKLEQSIALQTHQQATKLMELMAHVEV